MTKIHEIMVNLSVVRKALTNNTEKKCLMMEDFYRGIITESEFLQKMEELDQSENRLRQAATKYENSLHAMRLWLEENEITD